MKLLVGLGNPGRKYQRTRHNLGFLVVDRIAADHGIAITTRMCDALVGRGRVGEQTLVLAKPQRFMNRSGEAVKALIEEFGVTPEDLGIVYDELDLPFGRIRIRARGSAAGHRGMHSILDSIGDAPFYRVRVGIGRPPPDVDPAEFVLEPFTPDETERLDAVIARAAEAALCLIREGGERAMQQFNRLESVVNP
ncbi:MAG TPA: aminoacyl-tRNA hydrolase [Candidatus Eisenbacteria bacterium]|nr:aminoacyl-tRNA hydrolase [Candidatus Eisenbacteria bacterium]